MTRNKDDALPSRFFAVNGPNTSFVVDLMEVTGILYDDRDDTIKVYLSSGNFEIPAPQDNALEKILDAWEMVKGGAR